VKLTTHLHLVPRSRVRGAILPLPQYVFMAWCSFKTQGHIYLHNYDDDDDDDDDVFTMLRLFTYVVNGNREFRKV